MAGLGYDLPVCQVEVGRVKTKSKDFVADVEWDDNALNKKGQAVGGWVTTGARTTGPLKRCKVAAGNAERLHDAKATEIYEDDVKSKEKIDAMDEGPDRFDAMNDHIKKFEISQRRLKPHLEELTDTEKALSEERAEILAACLSKDDKERTRKLRRGEKITKYD